MRTRRTARFAVLGVASGLLLVAAILVAPWIVAAAEPNDTFDSATPITFNTTARDAIPTAGDVDYFAFTVGAAPTQLTTTLQELPANYDLELYGPDRSLIASSTSPSTLSESITYTAAQTGTYYLRVFSPAGQDSTSQYALRVDAVEPTPTVTSTPTSTAVPPTATSTATSTATNTPTDPYEPNDSYGTAYRASSGQTLQGRIHVATDRDFFKVLVPNAGSTIQATLTDLPADYDLYLDTPDQARAASSTNTGVTPESVTYDTGSTVGYFYVAVLSTRGASSPATYTLQVTVTSPPGAPELFAVDTTVDALDAVPGDGACRTAAGACSLRAAVQEANALAGPQSIVLPSGTLTLTIAGQEEDAAATGDLDVVEGSEVRMYGTGQEMTILDAGALDMLLDVRGALRLEALSITNGLTDRRETEGAAMALRNQGTTTLVRTTFTGNDNGRRNSQRNTCFHTVIENRGTLTVEASRIANNLGRGLYNTGTVTMRASTMDRNLFSTACRVLYGGGIFNDGGRVDVSASALTRNTSGYHGGAIVNDGTMTLTNVTVSGNSAGLSAGGIRNHADLTLTNVTIVGNWGGEGASNLQTGLASSTARVVLANSIIAQPLGYTVGNCSGAITSLGHNLDDGDTCGLRGSGDQVGATPALAPLADNGGSTETHALEPSSPAIDAADPAYCPSTDQRGVARPQGPTCDVGAFERQAVETTPAPTPSPTAVPSPTPTGVPVPSPGPNRLILPVVPNNGSPN